MLLWSAASREVSEPCVVKLCQEDGEREVVQQVHERNANSHPTQIRTSARGIGSAREVQEVRGDRSINCSNNQCINEPSERVVSERVRDDAKCNDRECVVGNETGGRGDLQNGRDMSGKVALHGQPFRPFHDARILD